MVRSFTAIVTTLLKYFDSETPPVFLRNYPTVNIFTVNGDLLTRQ